MNGIPPNAPIAIPDRSETESADCAICRDNDCNPAPLMTTTICNHTFHKICLDNWLIAKNTCPMCRAVLSNRAVEPTERVTHHVGSRFRRALDNIPMSPMRRAYIDAYKRARKRARIDAYKQARQRTYIDAYKQARQRACIDAYKQARQRACVRSYQHALRTSSIRSQRQSFDIGNPQSGNPKVSDDNLHNDQGTRLSLTPCTDMLPKQHEQERT